jgi:predicted MPP superfamily phosphohydrolase
LQRRELARIPWLVRRNPVFPLVVVFILALVVTYVGDHLIPDAWSLAARAAAWAGVASLVAAPFVSVFLLRTRHFALALAPLGLFIFLLTFTVLRDLLWLLARWFAPREVFEITSAVVVVLALVTFVFATLRARAVPRIFDVDVPIVGLDPSLEGFTIAQLSDVHVGRTLRRPFVERLVQTVNAMNPDLVAITGDLVDGGVHELRDDVAPLRDLKSRHGSWFVTGNHDYYAGALPWIDELRSLGVNVLLNAHHVLDHEGAPVVVGGVTDHTANALVAGHASDPHKAIAGAPADAFKLLLAHQPASAVQGAAAGFDLQLSGHTHGGQFFPGTLFARLVFPFVAGLASVVRKSGGAMWIYTSRGAGFTGAQLRTVPSEITRLRLVRAL